MLHFIKRFYLIMAALLLFPTVCLAGVEHFEAGHRSETLTLSADDSSVALSEDFVGYYLFQIEIFASADDAVTFSLNSEVGTQLFTTTTTAATSGEIKGPSAYYLITGPMDYTLSGLGSGTVTIVISAVK